MFYLYIWLLIWIDLLSKLYAQNNLLVQQNLIGDFLYFKYVENFWIAFSFPIEWILLKILTITLIWVIFWHYITQEKQKKSYIIDSSFIFILWWALWNGYERIFHGKVIDFIAVKYFSVFNLADIFITIGVILYISTIIFLDSNTYDRKW